MFQVQKIRSLPFIQTHNIVNVEMHNISIQSIHFFLKRCFPHLRDSNFVYKHHLKMGNAFYKYLNCNHKMISLYFYYYYSFIYSSLGNVFRNQNQSRIKKHIIEFDQVQM